MIGNTNKSQLDNEIEKLLNTGLWELLYSVKPNLTDDGIQLIHTASLIHADGMEISGVSDDMDLALKYFYENLKKIDVTEVIDLTNEHSHDAAIAAQ